MSAVTFLFIVLLVSSSTVAYADVLYIGEPEDAASAGDDEALLESFEIDELFVDVEHVVDEATPVKKSNPVAVLTGSVNKKIKGVGNAVDVALRGRINSAFAVQNQWPFLLAGLLFLMLLMRLKRRTRKNKFS